MRYRCTRFRTRACDGSNRRPTRCELSAAKSPHQHANTRTAVPRVECAVCCRYAVRKRLSRHGFRGVRAIRFECTFVALCAPQARATAPIDVRRGVCSTAKSPRQHGNRGAACGQWAVCRRSTARNRRGSHDTLIKALCQYLSNARSRHYRPYKGELQRQSTFVAACVAPPSHRARRRVWSVRGLPPVHDANQARLSRHVNQGSMAIPFKCAIAAL